MNQVQLIESVAKAGKIKKAAAGRAVKAMVTNIVDSLKSEGRVIIAGLGTFRVKSTKPRTGRNPKTGETIQIAAGKRVLFKPSLSLKKTLKS
ncbi:DNA-binding protein HU-beta [subsurface metagenome]|nr:DNA-binding protein HU [Clostridia bacterium]